jgi:hypothetical protein
MLSIVWTVSVGFSGKNFPSKKAGKTGHLSALHSVGVCYGSLSAFICLHKDWERRVSAVSKEFFWCYASKIRFVVTRVSQWLASVAPVSAAAEDCITRCFQIAKLLENFVMNARVLIFNERKNGKNRPLPDN